jgi:hypothetical protein
MELLETIKTKIKEFWKNLTDGADFTDIEKIVAGDTETLNKLVKNENFRKNTLQYIEELQKKNPDKPVKKLFHEVINQQFKTNKSVKTKLDKELILKPDIKHFSYLDTLADLGKANLTPNEIEFIQKNQINENLYGIVKSMVNLGVINEKDLQNPEFFKKNLQLTLQGYLKHKNIVEGFEKISQVLDAISLGTALFSGGTTLVVKGLVKKVGETALKRGLAKALISKGFLASDLSFLGARGVDLFTDVKLKNQNPSTSDVIFSGVALLPFVSPIKKQIAKVGAKFEPKVTGETIKNANDIFNLEWSKTLTEFSKKDVANVLVKTIEEKVPVFGKESGELVKKIQPVFVPFVEGFVKAYGDNLGLKFANAYVNPHYVTTSYKIKRDILKSFVSENLQTIEEVYKNLGNREKLLQIFETKPDLIDFFALNSSKYFLSKARYLKQNLERYLEKINKQIPDLDKRLILDLGEDFSKFVSAKGLNISHFTLDDLMHNSDAVKVFEDFIKFNVKEGKTSSPIKWFLKFDDKLEDLEKITAYKMPESIWNIYIPTSDFPQAFKILITEGESFKVQTMYLPNELILQFQKKAKNINEFKTLLQDYFKKELGITEGQIQILERYKLPQAFMPSKKAFKEMFGDIFSQYEKANSILTKLDNELEAVKETGTILKELEKRKKELRTQIKTIAEGAGLKTHKVRTDTLIKQLEDLGKLEPELADEITSVLKELKEAKQTEILLDAPWAKKLTTLLEKAEKLPTLPPEEVFYQRFVQMYYTPPWEFSRKTLEGFLKFTDFLDDSSKIDYLTRSYLRTYAHEERILFNYIHHFDDVIREYFGDTALGKAWNLVRTYHFGGEGLQASMIDFTSRMSRLFTLLNPAVPLGAYIQVKTGLSALFPSFKVMRTSVDFASELVKNPSLTKDLIQSYTKTSLPQHYLPSFYRFFENVLQNELRHALLKNPKFADEVKTFFGLKNLPVSEVDDVASLLTSLIDNPAGLSLLTGGSRIGNVLASIQSWYPFIVAPFQIASLNLLKGLTGTQRAKYIMNSLYLTALGTMFLPSTISPLTAPFETIRKLYEDIVAPTLATINLIFTDTNPSYETWLENKDPIVETLIKNLFANYSGIPKEKFTGRFFTDLGKMLALHGDEHHFAYTNIGMQKLIDILKRLDISEKGLISSGAVSTSFDFAFPVWQTIYQLIKAFAYKGETGEELASNLLDVATRINPVWRNMKYGLIRTLTGYGLQKDITQDKILADTIKDVVDDDRVGFLTGLAYNLGVLVSHPQAFVKMFDVLFTHSFIENAKTFGEELITGKPARIEYIYVPKVRNVKDFEEKIVGKEDLILSSIYKTENREVVITAFQNYFNVLGRKFEHKEKTLDIEKDRRLFRSLNLLVGETINSLPELENLIVLDYNNVVQGLSEKYGKDKVLMWLKEDYEDMRLRAKLAKPKEPEK